MVACWGWVHLIVEKQNWDLFLFIHPTVTVKCLSDLQFTPVSIAAESEAVSCWYNRMLCLHTWSETGGIWGRRKFRWSWVAIGSDKDSGGAHVYFISLHCGEHFSMVKTAKMELLRALVSECLSAAAQEIFKIVERTIIEYEEEMSCSKWVVDSHRRLLDVASPHSEGQFITRLLSIKEEETVFTSWFWIPEVDFSDAFFTGMHNSQVEVKESRAVLQMLSIKHDSSVTVGTSSKMTKVTSLIKRSSPSDLQYINNLCFCFVWWCCDVE